MGLLSALHTFGGVNARFAAPVAPFHMLRQRRSLIAATPQGPTTSHARRPVVVMSARARRCRLRGRVHFRHTHPFRRSRPPVCCPRGKESCLSVSAHYSVETVRQGGDHPRCWKSSGGVPYGCTTRGRRRPDKRGLRPGSRFALCSAVAPSLKMEGEKVQIVMP